MTLMPTKSVDEFEKLNKLGEGTYGVVYMARDKHSKEIYALKRLIMHNERKDGFPITSLREIGILKRCVDNKHCVRLEGVAISRNDKSSKSSACNKSSSANENSDLWIEDVERERGRDRARTGSFGFSNVFLVFEYCEHDLSQLLRRSMERQRDTASTPVFCPLFSEAQAKTVCTQLLSAVAFLHRRNILHRDIKPSNVLYNNRGEVKLADFGLARVLETANYEAFDARVYSRTPVNSVLFNTTRDVLMTPTVTTLWYRAIEVLLGFRTRLHSRGRGREHGPGSTQAQERGHPDGPLVYSYGCGIDIWSCGCVFGEILGGRPLCPGDDEVSQVKCIFALLGTPAPAQCPGLEDCALIADGSIELQREYTRSAVNSNCISDLFPRLSALGVRFLNGCLCYDPEARLTAAHALRHGYFNASPYPVGAEFMPTFPSTHADPPPSVSSHCAVKSTTAGVCVPQRGLGLGYGNSYKRKFEAPAGMSLSASKRSSGNSTGTAPKPNR